MISLRLIESIIGIITISIAYVVSATFAGYFQAWVAKEMGDDTAQEAGFLSWNPLVHLDPIGAFFLFYLGIGWGKIIPINAGQIKGYARLACAYFANFFAHLLLALISLIILLRIFGINMLELALAVIMTGYISLSALTYTYPETSSFVLAIALILVIMVYLNVLFAVLNFFIYGFKFLTVSLFPEFDRSREGDIIGMLIPFLAMVMFANTLRIYIIYSISHMASFIAQLLGAG